MKPKQRYVAPDVSTEELDQPKALLACGKCEGAGPSAQFGCLASPQSS